MEAWTTVFVAFIVAASTLFATYLQNRHSTKRFEKELAKQRELDSIQRRRAVREVPLLNLRKELARMAMKNYRVIKAIGSVKTETDRKSAIDYLGTVTNDLHIYTNSGELEQVLFELDDREILQSVDKLIGKLFEAKIIGSVTLFDNKPDELDMLYQVPRQVEEEVRQIQSLINKRLEQL